MLPIRVVPFAACCAVLLGISSLGGCDNKTVDQYVDKAKKAAEDASTSIKKAAKDTGESVKKAAKDTQAQLKKAADQTSTQIKKAAAQAREAVLPTGSLKLSLQAASSFDSCHATFSVLPGQTSVLTLRTAKTPSEESFPSVFIIASNDATQAAALSGKTLEAKIYAALKDENDVWTTTAPVKIQILSVEGNNIRGQFTGGEMRHVPSGATAIPSGEFIGVLPGK